MTSDSSITCDPSPTPSSTTLPPQQFKLAAFDLDGTLLKGDKTISEYSKKILKKASEKVHIVLASGRMAPVMINYAEQLQLDDYSLISWNGGGCLKKTKNSLESQNPYDKASVVFIEHIPHNLYTRLIEMIFTKKLVCAIYNQEQAHFVKFQAEQQSKIDFFIRLTNVRHTYRSNPQELYPLEVIKILIMCDSEDHQKKLYDELVTMPDDPNSSPLEFNFGNQLGVVKTECFDETHSGIYFVEVLPPQVNKGRSLTRLCSQLKVEAKEVIAFGDGLNDLEMLEWAGIGFCMKNSHPELKLQIPLQTTFSNDHDGVAKELLRILQLSED